MTTTATNRKKGRLRVVLLIAAALGSSSATMSGVLATLGPPLIDGSRATIA